MNKLIIRDLNDRRNSTKSFPKYTKEDISKYIENPGAYEKELRSAVRYLYGASPHFRRLIQYFTSLSDFAFIIAPYKLDPGALKPKTINSNYRKTLNLTSSMSISSQFVKILRIVLREDVFYGTIRETADNITIQQLPSDFCSISTIEGNVPNVTFDFSYFDQRATLLDYYPPEFSSKYKEYQRDKQTKWIELDSPNSFAIKCNDDILEYAMPPFAGILSEVYNLEDYKRLKLAKTVLDNYAMLAMRIPTNNNGEWLIDEPKARGFWQQLDSILPDEVGSVLTPMEIEKITLDNPRKDPNDTISEAEENMFTAAGVSSLLFNNEKASANALSLSIQVDQELTFGVVKSIEDALNRFLHSKPFGKNFVITFLNVSWANRKEAGDQYLKAAQYGLPTIMMYAASQGLGQAEMDSMSFLENDVLGLKEKLIPLKSSSTLSSKDNEGGRPTKDGSELSDSGEQSREDGDDW